MTTPIYTFGMNLEGITADTIKGAWNVERAKSSVIELMPTSGIITKQKDRKLDKTILEAYATQFMAEMLKQWNNVLPTNDFTLYTPPVLKIEYGNEEDPNSRTSKIYEFFCPGMPLNKIQKTKEKTHTIEEEQVRIEHRIAYLSGIVYEILRKEGVIHGDPNLRHFFLLPKNAQAYDITRDGTLTSYHTRNGLGIIDCENTRTEGPYSEGVNQDAEKFKGRVLTRFPHSRTEEYFNRGTQLVKTTDATFSETVRQLTKAIFQTRFPGAAKDVDLNNRKVTYR